MNEKQLLELKQEIDSKKIEISKLEGKKQHLSEQLKNDFKVSSIKEAHGKLKQMEEEISQLQEKINTGIEELEEYFEEDE